MDLSAFRERLDRWGEDIDAWPGQDAAAARRLLDLSPEARRLVAEAQLIRRAVAGPAPRRAPPGLLDRILDAARALPGPEDRDGTDEGRSDRKK